MTGIERANQDLEMSRNLLLLLCFGYGGGNARDGKGGKSEEVEHAGLGALIMR